MKTAAYTICKNEIQFVEKWLYYTEKFDYRVILDTGSTDGTYEAFLAAKNVIVEQKIFTPWRFDVARNYNLNMIPKDVDWCLSPDLDEYFSINVLPQMAFTIQANPTVTNISCDRLDIYNDVVRVGPPNMLGTNKIHRRNDYHWVQPIYEHLQWRHKGTYENEIYNPDIYLIHDQDFKKKSRPELYVKMLQDEFEANPTNCWTLWFLCNHYFKAKDLENFIRCGVVFVQHSNRDGKYQQIKGVLEDIYKNQPVSVELKSQILQALAQSNNTAAPYTQIR